MTAEIFDGERYWKVSACGNTAIMLRRPVNAPTVQAVRALLDDEQGLDADNLLLFSTKGCPKGLDIVVDGYNRDGSRVGLCGNGARGLTWLAAHIGDIEQRKSSFEMLMDDTRVSTRIQDFEKRLVSLVVQPPSFDPETVPFHGAASSGELSVLGKSYEYVVANVGNPQCILYVEGPPSEAEMETVGRELGEDLSKFPNRVNVSLCYIAGPDRVVARIYERGVGISPSSGTGSIAVATASRSFKGLGSSITVEMPGGSQQVVWQGGGALVEGITEVKLDSEGIISSGALKKSVHAA